MESSESATYRTIHCDRHGDNREAFMCQHLLEGSGLGFFTDVDDVSNPHPDAWCSICEKEREESGQFTDAYALATFKLVCGACYEEIKQKNITGPGRSSHIQ